MCIAVFIIYIIYYYLLIKKEYKSLKIENNFPDIIDVSDLANSDEFKPINLEPPKVPERKEGKGSENLSKKTKEEKIKSFTENLIDL